MAARIGFLVSHPIQYLTPLFRELARRCDLTVFFAHRQTAEQQARAGFGVAFDWDIDLLSGYPNQFLTNVSRQPSTDSFWGCNTPEIGRKIANGRFEAFIVPGWALWCYWQAVIACRRSAVPIFVRGDSQLVSQQGRLLRMAKELGFSSMLGRFDGFLYVGQRNREYLLRYGAAPERLFFAPHCIDNEAFGAGAERAREQGVSNGADRDGPRRILFVGKLVGRKNPLDVLRAAALVRNGGTAVEVVFAGAGELTSELGAFARSVDLPVEFRGFVNQTELPAVYAGSDVIALPSSGVETWGLVINEAMACGVPAVVSEMVGCGPDLIEPGGTGATFPLGDVAGMARAIETVLSLDPRRTRERVMARIAAYSPAAAASGILAGVEGLRKQLLPK
jgi:glycosyltransferase involved in cell wall biosynthesis